ncbi:MAG: 50S ribosomal protein L21 [Acidobacteriota bacterium]
MYAIIQTGGKQYRVSEGDLLRVELLDSQAEKVEFPDVFLISNGSKSVVGTPRIQGARVTGTVVGTGRLPKILVFKKKRRKHYKRTFGHRQYFTSVRIDSIDAGGAGTPRAAGDKTATSPRQGAPARSRKKTPARQAASRKKASPAARSRKTGAKRAAAGRSTRKTAGRATKARTTTRKKTTKKKTPKKKTTRKPRGRS